MRERTGTDKTGVWPTVEWLVDRVLFLSYGVQLQHSEDYTLTLLAHAGLFWFLHSPLNSDMMDYKIFNVRLWYLCLRILSGTSVYGWSWLKCCCTSTETVGLLGTGAQEWTSTSTFTQLLSSEFMVPSKGHLQSLHGIWLRGNLRAGAKPST